MEDKKPNFIGGHASNGEKFAMDQPVFLEALTQKEDKDGFLDPDKAATDINPPQNLEVLAEPKTVSFNPFRRTMPKKQVAKKSEQKRKKARKLQSQARRKNRKRK